MLISIVEHIFIWINQRVRNVHKVFDTHSLCPHPGRRHHTCKLHLFVLTGHRDWIHEQTLDQSRFSFKDDWNVSKSCQWYFVVCILKLLENNLWEVNTLHLVSLCRCMFYGMKNNKKVLIFMSVLWIIDCALFITVNWESNRGNETDCWRITLHQSYQRAVWANFSEKKIHEMASEAATVNWRLVWLKTIGRLQKTLSWIHSGLSWSRAL